jgi:hypothetical protein
MLTKMTQSNSLMDGKEKVWRGKFCWLETRPRILGGETHGAEGWYFLNALFVIDNFIPWGALLAEPKDPSKSKYKKSVTTKTSFTRHNGVRTYVFLRGCTSAVPLEDEPLFENFSFSLENERSSVREVEKCFDDGARDRVGAGVWDLGVVEDVGCDVAIKRDCWFEW